MRPLPEATLTLAGDGPGLEAAGRLLDAVPSAALIVAAPGHVRVRLEGWAGEVDAQATAARAAATLSDTDAASSSEQVPFLADEPEGASVVEAAMPASRLGDMVGDAKDGGARS